MKQKIVGVYRMGPTEVELVIREGYGAELWFTPESGKIPRIKIGVDSPTWREAISGLMHECIEMQASFLGCRYSTDPDYSEDASGFMFVMTHAQFSEITARAAMFVAACMDDLEKAWKQWRK